MRKKVIKDYRRKTAPDTDIANVEFLDPFEAFLVLYGTIVFRQAGTSCRHGYCCRATLPTAVSM